MILCGSLTLSVQLRRRETEASSDYSLCASMPKEGTWYASRVVKLKVGNTAMVATGDATGLFFQ